MTFTKLLTPIAVVAAMAVAVPAGAGQQGRGRARGHATASRGGHESHGGPVARVAPHYAHPYYSRPYYSHPYYAFRPRVSIGFGIWAGYPVRYPYPYDPYYNPYYNPYYSPYYYNSYAPSYGYAPPPPRYSGQDAYNDPSSPYPSQGYPESNPAGARYPAQPPPQSVDVQPGRQNAAGGVSFEITPGTAAVFVDGTYVGTAADFGPNTQPLGLAPGRHRLEVRADGYETMTFDADVTPGQFIPYHGTLQQRSR